MIEAMVIAQNVLCDECSREINLCDICTKKFYTDENIFCDDEGKKHYCMGCYWKVAKQKLAKQKGVEKNATR